MPTDDKYKRRTRGYPQLSDRDAKNVVQAEDEFVNWYSDPNTRRRFPGSEQELDTGVQDALDTKIFTGQPERGTAEYDSGTFYLDKEDKNYDAPYIRTTTTEKDVIGHELSHAAGFDDQLGQQLRQVLGKDDISAYRRQPGELYGNFHQMRLKLGIKPFERSWTPDTLMELIDFTGKGEDEDVRAYLNQYGPEKLSEALNTIASSERTNLSNPRNAIEFTKSEDLFA